tara:strand:- start:1382 stop:1624 length:243 start_codon:yes stop_codon:yes gene_type:complete
MFTVSLSECPPGLFLFEKCLGFKSEYDNDAFVVSSGEYFWGGTKSSEDRDALRVVPVVIEGDLKFKVVLSGAVSKMEQLR